MLNLHIYNIKYQKFLLFCTFTVYLFNEYGFVIVRPLIYTGNVINTNAVTALRRVQCLVNGCSISSQHASVIWRVPRMSNANAMRLLHPCNPKCNKRSVAVIGPYNGPGKQQPYYCQVIYESIKSHTIFHLISHNYECNETKKHFDMKINIYIADFNYFLVNYINNSKL